MKYFNKNGSVLNLINLISKNAQACNVLPEKIFSALAAGGLRDSMESNKPHAFGIGHTQNGWELNLKSINPAKGLETRQKFNSENTLRNNSSMQG